MTAFDDPTVDSACAVSPLAPARLPAVTGDFSGRTA
jgi:hypothetical protein